MKRFVAIALSVSLGIALGLAAVPVVEPRLPTSPTVVGLTIGGRPVPARTAPRSWLAERERVLLERAVVLRHGEARFEATLAELGATVDISRTLSAAEAVGHRGSVVRRLRETAQARRGEIDIPLVWTLDEAVATRYLAQFADELDQPAVDAQLDLKSHRPIPDVSGRELDIPATVEEIGATFVDHDELNLVTQPVPAKVTLNDLEDIDVTKVLSAFETKFRTWKKGRSHNVALATERLNGLILRPDQTMSFNERVGPRTVERGFQQAPEIVGDELSMGIGGGTCQVSSTLHGAALHGGLAVLQRKSHSRPSAYTKLGLDATVSYPSVDLKLQNPFDFTIVVHAFIPEPGLLRVELLGGEAVEAVEYKYGISRVEAYVRRITTKEWLKPGRVMRKQKGTRGMDVHSYVKIVYKDGRVEERKYYSGYRATPEVYWVSPSYDEEELPPLPAHAKGVEGRLGVDGSDVYPTAG